MQKIRRATVRRIVRGVLGEMSGCREFSTHRVGGEREQQEAQMDKRPVADSDDLEKGVGIWNFPFRLNRKIREHLKHVERIPYPVNVPFPKPQSQTDGETNHDLRRVTRCVEERPSRTISVSNNA